MRAGLTIQDLADRCTEQGTPVHFTTIGKLERQINAPRPKLARALADALGVAVDDLLDGDAA